MDGMSLGALWDDLRTGALDLNPGVLAGKLLSVCFRQLLFHMRWFGQILMVAVICVIMEQLKMAFAREGAAKITTVVCLILIVTLSVKGFNASVSGGRAAIQRMGTFMEILLPMLLSLLLAMGHGSTVLLMKPLLTASLSLMTALIYHVIFPLIFVGLALSLVNHLSDSYKLSKSVQFIQSGIKWAIGLAMTLFIGILGVQGGFGSVSDGILLRTAKYLTSSVAPVAGGLFADAVDTVAGTSLIFKNALGVLGLVCIAVFAFGPLLGIFVQAMLLRLGSALIQPFGDQLAGDVLDDIADAMMMVFTATAAVAVMFFLTLTMMLLAANATVMFR
jgi:stage III sporulation protein AE